MCEPISENEVIDKANFLEIYHSMVATYKAKDKYFDGIVEGMPSEVVKECSNFIDCKKNGYEQLSWAISNTQIPEETWARMKLIEFFRKYWDDWIVASSHRELITCLYSIRVLMKNKYGRDEDYLTNYDEFRADSVLAPRIRNCAPVGNENRPPIDSSEQKQSKKKPKKAKQEKSVKKKDDGKDRQASLDQQKLNDDIKAGRFVAPAFTPGTLGIPDSQIDLDEMLRFQRFGDFPDE